MRSRGRIGEGGGWSPSLIIAITSPYEKPLPFCVQQPIRLTIFLCFPIFFIVFISESKSTSSTSVAFSKKNAEGSEIYQTDKIYQTKVCPSVHLFIPIIRQSTLSVSPSVVRPSVVRRSVGRSVGPSVSRSVVAHSLPFKVLIATVCFAFSPGTPTAAA